MWAHALVILLAPAVWKTAGERSRALGGIGPVVPCYVTGVLWTTFGAPVLTPGATRTVTGLMVIVAIAALLLSTDLRRWVRLARPTLVGALLTLPAALVSTAVAAILFGPHVPNSWQVGGMLVGVCTGGTANLAAVAHGLQVSESLLGTVLAAEMLVGAVYLLFLLSVGPAFFGRWLRPFQGTDGGHENATAPTSKKQPPSALVLRIARAFGLSAVVAVAGAAPALALGGTLQPIVAILGVTTLSMALSLASKIRSEPGLFPVGDYALLGFCVAAGSLTPVSELLSVSLSMLGYAATVFIGAAIVHFLLCMVVGLDRDTTVITCTSALYSPAFVPAVARALRNREVIPSGVTAGLAGFAVGNYLGYGVAWVLRHFS